MNGSTDRYGATRIFFSGIGGDKSSLNHEIEKAWAALGIKAELTIDIGSNTNKYFLDGKEISQEEARQHAMKVTGHQMQESDWKW